MKIAYIIFNGIALLDFIGVYEPISQLKSKHYLPDLSWDVCSFTDSAKDNFGLELIPSKVKNSLSDYDAVIIPGGRGTRALQFDNEFINWIKTAKTAKYKISICTGSLILGAAGFLIDKKATTHFQAFESLKPYCKEVLSERIVEDGSIITAAGVSSSIDLGLYLCKKWAGEKAETEIRRMMEYRG